MWLLILRICDVSLSKVLKPKIHILHNKCTKLITDIALRFINKSKIYGSKGTLLNTDELL